MSCNAVQVAVVWVTGNSGTGKSTVCSLLRAQGHLAFDADYDGYCHWFDRTTGVPVEDPPDPVPPGWLNGFGWHIDRAKIEALAAGCRDKTAFLCGSAENEADVLDLFNLVICLVVDDDTLRRRIETRTNNAFGQHPEELAAIMGWNPMMKPKYQRIGAAILDGTLEPADVAQAVLAAAERIGQHRGP
jgi:hypothetical protein